MSTKDRRVFLIVLDSVGVGEMPDSAEYGDAGSNTLAACARSEKLDIPNLRELGIFNIEGVGCGAPVERPAGDTAGPEGYRLAGSGGLAFDHGRILAWALRRLRREVETSRLPFHLLPERFTLTQLQQVCETMLGRPLLKAAFRRKIAPLVEDTGEYAQRAGHRPARLYRRKEQER